MPTDKCIDNDSSHTSITSNGGLKYVYVVVQMHKGYFKCRNFVDLGTFYPG